MEKDLLVQEKDDLEFDQFKMNRFKNIPPKVKVHKDSGPSKTLGKVPSDSKLYIKKNMKDLKELNTNVQKSMKQWENQEA